MHNPKLDEPIQTSRNNLCNSEEKKRLSMHALQRFQVFPSSLHRQCSIAAIAIGDELHERLQVQ
jgi:hypothetical protein